MNRSLFIAALLLSAAASAEMPDFSKGGVLISLQYGYGMWNLDQAKLASQVGADNAAVIKGDTQNAQAAGLTLGYNILGHATVEATLIGTGWNITDANRGGGGFITGGAHWHPIQLFVKEPRFYDASLFVAFGYGIMGQNRGMDGFAWQYGADLTFFPTKVLGIGVTARNTMLGFSNFYIDYDNRSQPGNTINMPQGSGGSFLQLGVALTVRVAP